MMFLGLKMAFPHGFCQTSVSVRRSRPGLALDEPHPALLYEALLPFLTKEDGAIFRWELIDGKAVGLSYGTLENPCWKSENTVVFRWDIGKSMCFFHVFPRKWMAIV